MQTNTLEKEILFQKLGNTWYAFTEIENDVVYSALPDGVDPKSTNIELFHIIEKHMKRVAKYNRDGISAGIAA